MARKHLKHGSLENLYPRQGRRRSHGHVLAMRPADWTDDYWHHPIPKSRGGTEIVPMHPICQQALITNFSNAELQRHRMDVEGLLANPNVREPSTR